MTTFEYGLFSIDCHRCLNNEEFDAYDWHEGMDEAKSVGWVARQVDGEWYNFCSNVCFFYFQKDQKRLLETERAKDAELARQHREAEDDREQELVDLLPF